MKPKYVKIGKLYNRWLYVNENDGENIKTCKILETMISKCSPPDSNWERIKNKILDIVNNK